MQDEHARLNKEWGDLWVRLKVVRTSAEHYDTLIERQLEDRKSLQREQDRVRNGSNDSKASYGDPGVDPLVNLIRAEREVAREVKRLFKERKDAFAKVAEIEAAMNAIVDRWSSECKRAEEWKELYELIGQAWNVVGVAKTVAKQGGKYVLRASSNRGSGASGSGSGAARAASPRGSTSRGSAQEGTPSGSRSSINPDRGSVAPRNLKEKLAADTAAADPDAGKKMGNIVMGDSRWPAADGWEKWKMKVNGVNVHYVRNKNTGKAEDFKIKVE